MNLVSDCALERIAALVVDSEIPVLNRVLSGEEAGANLQARLRRRALLVSLLSRPESGGRRTYEIKKSQKEVM